MEPFRTTHAHVVRMAVGDAAGRDGCMHQHPAGALEQADQLGAGITPAAANLDNDALRLPDPLRGLRIIRFRGAQGDRIRFRQFIQVETREPGGLGVHRHEQVEGAGAGGMVHGGGAALQGGWQCQRGMQRISLAQAGGQLQEQALGVPGHLLHVEAFILGGFVAA